jgi:hypothetical protein
LGGLEFDWDEETQRWEFHVHVMTTAIDHRRELRGLKAHFPRTDEVRRPWWVETVETDVTNVARALSYCLKHHPCRKPTYQARTATLANGSLKTFTSKYQLQTRESLRALKFLARHRPEDFAILIKPKVDPVIG